MKFNVVKEAAVAEGWAIGLLEMLNYKTEQRAFYSVVRINPQGQFIELSRHATFAKASGAANREWCADRSALGKGI